MTLTGRPDDPPTFCAPAINDTATGMWCVIGALAALQQREHTGKGCVVDTSLFESAVAWVQGAARTLTTCTGNLPQRHGAASATLAPYQMFETADRPICIAAGNDRLFVKLARAMGHPRMVRRPALRPTGASAPPTAHAVVAAMQPVLLTRTRQDWMGIIGEAGVPCAPVNNIAELAETEQLQAMDMMRTLPGSDVRVVGLPITFDRQRPHPRRDSPRNSASMTAEILDRPERPVMTDTIDRARRYQDELTEFRRDIHAHPELGLEEHRTAERVAGKLEEWGIEVHRGVGKTGVVGVLRNGDGPSIGLRADMDALAMEEQTNLPYRQPEPRPRCTPAAMTATPPCCWARRSTWRIPGTSKAR